MRFLKNQKEKKKEDAERLEKLEQYRLMLAEDGIELHELSSIITERKAKRTPRPARYKFSG